MSIISWVLMVLLCVVGLIALFLVINEVQHMLRARSQGKPRDKATLLKEMRFPLWIYKCDPKVDVVHAFPQDTDINSGTGSLIVRALKHWDESDGKMAHFHGHALSSILHTLSGVAHDRVIVRVRMINDLVFEIVTVDSNMLTARIEDHCSSEFAPQLRLYEEYVSTETRPA